MYVLYLKLVAMLVLFLGSFGMILPTLISAPSDIAVVGGLIYLLVVFPYATYQLSMSIKKDEIRVPDVVKTAIDAKIEATQRAQQRANEVATAKAEADKKVEEARGNAESILKVAEAQAKANKLVAESLTSELVKYFALEKWDGKLPTFTGSDSVPMIQLPNLK